ncbi:MAG: DUF1624 domain-containing protein [Parafilimonas sp.]
MPPALQQTKQRIQSIDILRGIVMLIMALDHTRDFFHVTAMTDDPLNFNTTTPLLFFTRWITHFCAPAFVFLSGTSAFLAGRRKSKKELSTFLMKRGLWLLIVEIVIMSLIFSFNPLYNIIFLQVIWVIGWSMILLGLLVRTSTKLIIITGAVLFFGHNILDYVQLPKQGPGHVLWSVLFTAFGTMFKYGETRFILDLYAILPWTGVMFLGYGFGKLYQQPDDVKRKKTILSIGFAVIIFFIVLRYINQYGDPSHWSKQKNSLYTFLSFLNTSKYPPSLCYLCMTLGPVIVLLALTETVQNKFARFAGMYGRVPFFYYVLHFFLIHVICVILFFVSGHTSKDIVDMNSPFLFRPQHFGFSLGIVYVLWITVILALYKPCKWFDTYRKTHSQWWLSYL